MSHEHFATMQELRALSFEEQRELLAYTRVMDKMSYPCCRFTTHGGDTFLVRLKVLRECFTPEHVNLISPCLN